MLAQRLLPRTRTPTAHPTHTVSRRLTVRPTILPRPLPLLRPPTGDPNGPCGTLFAIRRGRNTRPYPLFLENNF